MHQPGGMMVTSNHRREVSLREAAEYLGITKPAALKRLRRGTLEGVKVDGEWRIRLPEGETVVTPSLPAVTPVTPEVAGLVAAKDAYIAHLETEIEYLRERLKVVDRVLGEHPIIEAGTAKPATSSWFRRRLWPRGNQE